MTIYSVLFASAEAEQVKPKSEGNATVIRITLDIETKVLIITDELSIVLCYSDCITIWP